MYNISYDEILTMMYLSLLIYNYDINSEFILKQDQTIEEYVNNLNNKYINGINDIKLDKIETNGILYLKNNFADGKVISFIDNKNIQLAIIVSEILKIIVIVFRGTDSFTDIIYDCYISKKYLDKNIFIHSGFYNQLNSVYGELMIKVEKYLNDYQIYISGHSAGGAHSTIFSYLLSKKTEKIIKVITFGSPKIGNYEWKQSYESKKNILNYRITNNNDIVSVIPIYNYYHVGINIHISNDNIIICNDIDCNFFYFNKNILFTNSICDHCLFEYYNNFINKEEIFENLIKLYNLEFESKDESILNIINNTFVRLSSNISVKLNNEDLLYLRCNSINSNNTYDTYDTNDTNNTNDTNDTYNTNNTNNTNNLVYMKPI